MSGSVPINPKIYHIVHVDKLPSVLEDEVLLCDAAISRRAQAGTTIGMSHIKTRRLSKPLASHPSLHVGDCVPFYFCPRSVMLYLIHRGNHPDLGYCGGQTPVVHLEADLKTVISWAEDNGKRWAFTDSNAGSNYFNDFADLSDLDEVEWDAVATRSWSQCREGKQAEFLIEEEFPWNLVDRIGVYSQQYYTQVRGILTSASVQTSVEIKSDWYY